MMKKMVFCLIPLILALIGCASSSQAPAQAETAETTVVQAESPAPAATADELDAAIREASDYLNKQVPAGNKLLIPNIQSDFPALSEYIIDGLIANTVNDQVFSVVDRSQLDAIRSELDFQYSGELDDDTMQALGQMAEAQIIVSGSVSKTGDLYHLQVRALSVQSAEIEGQFNRDIPNGPTIAALTRSAGTSVATTPDITYEIGDIGPAGGIVFYDKSSNAGGWRYMEAAPVETEQRNSWGDIRMVSGTSLALGDGKRNTQLIVEVLRNAKIEGVAQYCDELEYGGYTDWFMPSRDELNLMYKNLKVKGLGSFADDYYWSSTDSASSPYSLMFDNGEERHSLDKNVPLRVRAVRQF